MGWRVSDLLNLVWGGRGKTTSVFRRSCDCSKKQQQNYRLTFKKLPSESREASNEYDFWPRMDTFFGLVWSFFYCSKNRLVSTNMSHVAQSSPVARQDHRSGANRLPLCAAASRRSSYSCLRTADNNLVPPAKPPRIAANRTRPISQGFALRECVPSLRRVFKGISPR